MPILEDMPIEEKVRTRQPHLKTHAAAGRRGNAAQLINDDDQVVAAAAIHLVERAGIWSLADDLEHVLAHRDAQDWYVFEAASWALAERRLAEPAPRSLARAAAGGGCSPAAAAPARFSRRCRVDELFRIAGSARQVRHESGTVLAQEGLVSERVHLLLDGQVTATSREAAPHSVAAPASLGFVEALQGLPMPESLRTSDIAVTLALTGDEFRTLLADNTDLVSGLFATLTERSDWAAAEPVHSTGAGPELEPLAAGGVTGIEKVLALQRVPLFARVSAGGMQELAAIAQTVTMTAGSELFAESAPQAMWLLLSGELALTSPSAGHFTARGGDAIGSISGRWQASHSACQPRWSGVVWPSASSARRCSTCSGCNRSCCVRYSGVCSGLMRGQDDGRTGGNFSLSCSAFSALVS